MGNDTGSIVGGVVCAAIALFALSIVIWPRWYIWVETTQRFTDRPEPRRWYVAWTRAWPLIPTVVFGVAAIMLLTAPARDAAARDDREAAASAAVARCLELRPLLADAVSVTEPGESGDRGAVRNPDDLEVIAHSAGARIEWKSSSEPIPDLRHVVSGRVIDDESGLFLLTIAAAHSGEHVMGDCDTAGFMRQLEERGR